MPLFMSWFRAPSENLGIALSFQQFIQKKWKTWKMVEKINRNRDKRCERNYPVLLDFWLILVFPV